MDSILVVMASGIAALLIWVACVLGYEAGYRDGIKALADRVKSDAVRSLDGG